MKLYEAIASLVVARENCIKSNNTLWQERHEAILEHIAKNRLLSGSGIDCGTKINLDASNARKFVLTFSFHHMNESGYDGWTEHTLVVTPGWTGPELRITGPDRNDIKDYLYQTYDYVLRQEITREEQLKAMGLDEQPATK